MSLLRRQPRPPAHVDNTAAHQRISILESEIRELRPSRVPSEPPAAMPIPIDRSTRALHVLAEMARQQVTVGQFEEARRSVADAVLLLDETKDEVVVARVSVMLAESLLALDLPNLAKPRLTHAVQILERLGEDPRWRVRARLALGRALIALDDPAGLDVLDEARDICQMLGEKAAVAQIDAELREAEKTFDTPRHIHTGYGRPVSIVPPPHTT